MQQWRVDNFSIGVHTQPSRVGDGAGILFASESVGLRADANGHLQQRVAFAEFSDEGEGYVTGVAADGPYLLYLRSDGTVWLKESSSTEGARRLSPIPEGVLSGQLSFIVIGDYAIFKATTGPAYWVDLREDSETRYRAFELGIVPPTFRANSQYIYPREGEGLGVVGVGFAYVYRWTYIRSFGATLRDIRDDIGSQEFHLFQGMESNPGPPQIFYGGPNNLRDQVRKFFDDDGHRYVAIGLGGWQGIQFSGLQHSPDPQVTGIALYQSEPVDAYAADDVNIDQLQYRRIEYIPKGVAHVYTGESATPDKWAQRILMRQDNHKLPATAKELVFFNDNLYTVTGDELRATEFRNGNLALWAFPETNAVRRAGIRTLIEHRGVLLFGGPDSFYRLSGATIKTGQVDSVGSIGPVSEHAFAKLEGAIVLVGSAGFYAFDGGTVQKLSGALDAYFHDKEIRGGTAVILPSGEILFAISNMRNDNPAVWLFEDGWFRLTWTRFYQFASWHVRNRFFITASDGTKTLKRLQWEYTGVDNDDGILIPFSWKSQRLNFGSEDFKRFRELQIEGFAPSLIHDSPDVDRGVLFSVGTQPFGAAGETWVIGNKTAPLQVDVWIDGKHALRRSFSLIRDDAYPQRVPINRRGRAIQFQISGHGAVQIRSLQLEVIS